MSFRKFFTNQTQQERQSNQEQRALRTEGYGQCLQKFSILSNREMECLKRNGNDRFGCKSETSKVAAVEQECQSYQEEIERLDNELYPRRPGK